MGLPLVGRRGSLLVGLLLGLCLASLLQWVAEERGDPTWVELPPRREELAWPHGAGGRAGRAGGRRGRARRAARRAERAAVAPAAGAWAPRPCARNCSGAGVCNADTGHCLCGMGRRGDGCEVVDEFPCNMPRGEQVVNRCAGRCDLAASACTCGGGKFPRRDMFKCEFRGLEKWLPWQGPGWDYARTAASPRHLWSSAADAPGYLTNAVTGLVAGGASTRRTSWKNSAWSSESLPPRSVAWCDVDPEAMRRGAERPAHTCACNEGSKGTLCEIPTLHACLNQCNGRGACTKGYCTCDDGWCASRIAPARRGPARRPRADAPRGARARALPHTPTHPPAICLTGPRLINALRPALSLAAHGRTLSEDLCPTRAGLAPNTYVLGWNP